MTTDYAANRSAFEEMLLKVQQESRERRLAHPDWPAHHPAIYFPGGGAKIYESMPVGRLRAARGYCKYCHQTHRNWWMMDQRDYTLADPEIESGQDAIILCGECEHTSRASFANVDPPFVTAKAKEKKRFLDTPDPEKARRACKTDLERQQFDGLVLLHSALQKKQWPCFFRIDLLVADAPTLQIPNKNWHIVCGGDDQGFDLWLTASKSLQFGLTLDQAVARCAP